MKIVLVIDQFDDGNNGTTVTARRFAHELRKLGHQVTILAGGEPAENKICAPIHKVPVFQKLIESQGMCFAKPCDEAYYEAFHDADIVHFYMPFRFCRRGEELARQMNIPTIAAFHVQPENITSSIKMGKNKTVNRFLYWMFYHIFYNRFRCIHCPSEFIAGQLAEHGYDAKCYVISNGVDDVFVPHPEIKQTRRPDEVFRILMIGRLSGEKRQDLIIEAAKRSRYHKRIQLIFAGKGPKEAEYRKLAKGLEKMPVFGFYSTDELVKLINSCDLYVHASDAEIEGISCMEALSCGLVPVISNSPLSATMQFALDERSLFSAGDAQSLADRIDYWIAHPEERLEMEQAYAHSGDGMRVSSCVRRAEEMYRQAIELFEKKGYKHPEETAVRRLTHPNTEKVARAFAKHSGFGRSVTAVFTNVISAIMAVFDHFFLGFSVVGRENLTGIQGGAVTVSNHVHELDCTMVKAALFPHFLRFLSLRRNLELPFVGWLLRACGVLPLPEHPVKLAKFQHELERAIADGEWLHYYPEGMLVKYHPGIRPFHSGAFLTAVRAHCPVIPLKVTYQPPQGRLCALWRKKPFLRVEILPPLYANPLLSRREAVTELMERTQQAMQKDRTYGEPLAETLPGCCRGEPGRTGYAVMARTKNKKGRMNLKNKLREYFSIPNILTYIRIILIPCFVWAYVSAREPKDYFLAAGLLLLSGLTDVADGFIARHFHMITDWGKAVDPVADKLTQASIAFCLVFRYPWMWLLLGLFAVKELYMGIASLYLLRRGKRLNGAMWFGKASTAVFYIVTIILIAYPPMPLPIAYSMMTVSGIFLLMAFLLYIPQFTKLYQEYRAEQEQGSDQKQNAQPKDGTAV